MSPHSKKPARSPETGLRILSYNIHKGFTTRNRKFVLAEIRDAIREVHPDLIFLQEVLGEHQGHKHRYQDWPEESQFEFLAHELWPHFAYGKNAVYSSGHHGNAILSKFPISFWENIDVSTSKMERRGILHAVIEVPGALLGHARAKSSYPFHALCVHLGLLEADRARQVDRLCERIDSHVPHGEPLAICGDFNDWRKRASQPLQKKLEVTEAFFSLHGAHARTFPSWLPALRLDRVYFRGMQVQSAETLTGRPWSELSDHIALLVELEGVRQPADTQRIKPSAQTA
jgi:endonuclease/exonuclease/phosphatase family metal-dependent hydrolase